MTVHLELMSKQKLIAITKAAAVNAERQRQLADYWRGYVDRLVTTAPHIAGPVSVAAVRAEAQRILDEIGPDPRAEEHRDILFAELTRGGNPRGRAPMPGPRCGRPNCNQRLNPEGRCTRCQWRAAA